MSQITTHVLDTAAGKPAGGVPVRFYRSTGDDTWEDVARGITNADGRIASLLPASQKLVPGTYCLAFDTKTYFGNQKTKAFYPKVEIVFEVLDSEHYHVPLLLSPFGYSTYRGS